MQLSKYFSLSELTISQTAARHGLDNTPSPALIENLRSLCVNVLDPIRELAGHPIHVSSGYRSSAVNRRVGGSATSQHCFGQAADITCPALGQQGLFQLILASGLPFDQVIDEFRSWVHVSWRPENRRGQVLTARTVRGRTVYSIGSDE